MPSLLGLVFTGLLILVLSLVHRALSPLRSIPGPFLARFTKAWHFLQFRSGSFEQVAVTLHRQYNSQIVRYGPNQYSISDPEALRKIYNYSNGFDKSLRYEPWFTPGRTMLFTEPKEDVHRQMRRTYQDMYSVSSMMKYEAVVDHCVALLCERLDERAHCEEELNLATWFLCYAADTISMMTWSVRFGYLDEGKDVHGLLASVHEVIAYAASVGIYHGLHSWIFWLRETSRRLGFGKGAQRAALVRWIGRRLSERRTQRESKQSQTGRHTNQDMLDDFLDANERSPDKFDEARIYDGLTGNVVAGSDTTAIALCSVVYHLTKTPSVLETLQAEIANVKGSSSAPLTFKQIQELPYLQAVIQEALRVHPPVGSHLERVVPTGGLEVAGHHLPPGTIVGANAWVVHREPEIFGKDAADFRPERWLEADAEQLAQMKRNFMAFGLGSRLCLGRNISMLEISKLIPEVISRFEFKFAAEGEVTTKNVWFVFFNELKMRVSRASPVGIVV